MAPFTLLTIESLLRITESLLSLLNKSGLFMGDVKKETFDKVKDLREGLEHLKFLGSLVPDIIDLFYHWQLISYSCEKLTEISRAMKQNTSDFPEQYLAWNAGHILRDIHREITEIEISLLSLKDQLVRRPPTKSESFSQELLGYIGNVSEKAKHLEEEVIRTQERLRDGNLQGVLSNFETITDDSFNAAKFVRVHMLQKVYNMYAGNA